MNKTFVFFILISSLFVAAVTTVLGQSHLMSPFVVFPVLSLAVPIFMHRMDQYKDTFTWSTKYFIYSWLIAVVTLFFTTFLSFSIESPILMMIVIFLAYFFTQVLIELVALLMTMFFDRTRRWGVIDEAIDMCVYILPVPFVYIGSILYMDLQDPIAYLYYGRAIDVNIFIAEMILLILALLVFVIYMYPKFEKHKFPSLLRIIVTAGMWLAMNAHILYGGYVPDFVKALAVKLIPMYQGNLLVFITPGLMETVFIIASVLIGKVAELLVLKALNKK